MSEGRQGEIPFVQARDQVESEVESYLKQSGFSTIEIPGLVHEKGETRFFFSPISLDKTLIFEAISVLKNHIENIRIHTFEQGYIVFQSLGSNIYDTKQFSSGIKFKFISIAGDHRIEIIRRGDFNQDEIQACLAVFRLFHPTGKRNSPAEKLKNMGINIYTRKKRRQTTGEQTQKSSPLHGNETTEIDKTESGIYEDIQDTWDSLSGYEKTKQEVVESIVLPFQSPEIFRSVASLARGRKASNLPSAILFEGPPGVGKTTMARIIARETGLPMVYVPVENILSKYYGESAQNMAGIFDAAAEFDQVLLFLDEIDSLAGSREDGLFEATRRVLSVLLRKIDGFEKKDGVLTIGATNRAGDLDNALLSRFDQILTFPLPDERERNYIFQSYASHLGESTLQPIAEMTTGLSGRNIQDICETAERRWARILIEKQQQPSAPPVDLYLQVSREKMSQERWR